MLSHSYVLVVNQQPEDSQVLEQILSHLNCQVKIATSREQALRLVGQTTPYLVILTEDQPQGTQGLVLDLRARGHTTETMTVVALTDICALSWMHQEETPGLDGLLVRPVSPDILSSLVHSACARYGQCSL